MTKRMRIIVAMFAMLLSASVPVSTVNAAKKESYMLSCMPCNDLVTALFPFPYNSRHQHSMLSDALNHLFQFFIRTDLKRVVMKLMQLRKRYLFHITRFCSFLLILSAVM